MAVPVGMPDHALLTRARDGDGEAFEALYRRHHRAATRAAHSYSSRTQLAEDAVQEAFMRILHATQEGGGPKTEFRAYLATTVRHVIAGWTRGERTILTDELDELAGEDTRDSHRPESRLRWHLLTKAFKSLPTRWQEALWLGEVEGVAPAELAERWNMSANSAAALSYRAREGLRTAWLDAHVNEGLVPDECRPFVADLSRYTQGKLTDRRELQVRSHLEDCEYCRGVLFEVDTAASELRVLLLIPVAAWGGLAIAGAGVAGGTLAGLAKLGGGLGTRGLALGAASTAAVTAIVVVTVAMNPGIADAFGTDPAGARPLVTLGPAGGSGTDDGSDDDADEDSTEDPSDEPTQEPTDGPSDDPTAVPTADADDAAPGPGATGDDDAPTGTDPEPSTDPTSPTTTPPVAPPTDDPDDPAVPAPPVIDYTVVDGNIVLVGTGEPGATISLQSSAVVGGGGGGTGATGRAVVPRAPAGVLANVTVDSAGKWTLTPDLDAVVGLRISAIQTTHDGRVSTAATVDLPSRPAAPVVVVGEPVGPLVTVSGQAVAGATVTLRTVDGTSLPNPVVDSGGAWSASMDLTLWGGHSVVATQQDAHGMRSPASAAADLPLYITLTGTLGGDGTIIFSGTGQPGASVAITTGQTVLSTATVSGDGSWSAAIPADPALSEIEVVATQTVSNRTSTSAPFTVPVINAPLAVLSLAATLGDGTIVFNGFGEPGATVTVTTDERVLSTAIVLDDGSWSSTITAEPTLSEVAVVATQTVEGREPTTATATVPFIAPPAVVPTPQILATVLANGTLTVTGTSTQSGTIVVRVVGGEDLGSMRAGTLWVLAIVDDRIRADSLLEAVLVVNGVESKPVPLSSLLGSVN